MNREHIAMAQIKAAMARGWPDVARSFWHEYRKEHAKRSGVLVAEIEREKGLA